MSKMETYGLTSKDLVKVRDNMSKQKDYLEQNSITTSKGDKKSYMDISYSANHSKRYYPRILNKTNTFIAHGLNKGHVPLFLTVTMDGFFRDFLKGDYSRWEKFKKQYVLGNHIPNNDRNGHYLDLISREAKLSPKDLYKIAGHQLHRFTKSLGEFKKHDDTFSYSFLRVTEPHKDGVPHFHILMYAPLEYVPNIYKEFIKCFPAPRNSLRLTKHNTFGKNKRNGNKIAEGIFETHGFQTEIRNPVGYILKYILKSFVNLIKDEELDYLQAWYIKNRIPRLISTHTLVSQEIYHKSAILEDDWYYLTHIKIDGGFYKSKDGSYFRFDDGIRQVIGNNGYYAVYNSGKLVNSYGAYNYSSLIASSKTYKFTSVRPPKFNYFLRYVSHHALASKKYNYKFKIHLKEQGNMFMSFTNKDDFFFTTGDNEYHELDKETISFEVNNASFYKLMKTLLGVQSALHNHLVQSGDIDASLMSEYDFYFSTLSSSDDDSTDYPNHYEFEETQGDMINELLRN